MFISQVVRRTPPATDTPTHNPSLTPQKAASLKSTYIQQIKELHSLQEVGAIARDDFVKQRDVLLAQMNKCDKMFHSSS